MKKRILSALLALCMVFALGTVGAMAEEPVATTTASDNAVTLHVNSNGTATERAEGAVFQYLSTAIEKAHAGDKIIIDHNIEADNGNAINSSAYGIYVIDKELTIEGADSGITITAKGDKQITYDNGHDDVHLFNITSGKVTISNITINGQYTSGNTYYVKHGIQAYGSSTNVTLNNVTANNCFGYGVVVNNGAIVTANSLNASGNGWGGVNVDGKTNSATFTMNGGNLKGNGGTNAASVVIESQNGGKTETTLENGEFDNVATHVEDGKSVGNDTLTINGGNYVTVAASGQGRDTFTVNGQGTTITTVVTDANGTTNFTVSDATVTTVMKGAENVTEKLGESGIDFIGANVGGSDVNTVAASIGDTTYSSFKEALDAAANGSSDATIIMYANVESPISEVEYVFNHNIKIEGNGHSVEFVPASGEETVAFTVNNSTLTLDNVKMTVSGSHSVAGNSGVAFSLNGTNSGLIVANGTELTLTTLDKGIIMPNETAKVEIQNDSTLTIHDIDGNASNGGAWKVSDSATLTVSNCGSYGLSVYSLETTGTSNVNVSNTGIGAIYATKTIKIGTGTTVNIENCCTGTMPYTSKWGSCNAPIQIVTDKENHSIPADANITIENGANVTVTGTNSNATADIYVVAGTGFNSDGNVKASVALEETDSPAKALVTFVDNGVVIDSYLVNINYNFNLPANSNSLFAGWKDDKGTTYGAGANYTVTGDVTFTAQYSEPVVPEPDKYSINLVINNGEGGSASVNKDSAAKGEKVTVSVSTKAGYISGVRVVTDSGTPVTMSDTSFTMPGESVTVTVTFTATTTPAEEHRVNVYDPSNDHGNFYVSPTTQVQGEYVYIYTSPDRGYTVDRITITNHTTNSTFSPSSVSNSENTYRFRMPDSEVTVRVYFKLDNEFDINLSYNRNYGSVTARVDGDVTYVAQEYDRVYIYTEPNKGYMVKDITVSIDAWDEVEVELEREGVYSFRMPDADVEVEVTFAPGYEITIDDDIRYGEIATDPEDYAAEDDTVEVYFKPSNGYKLKTIEVFTGKDFDDEVTVRLHSSGDYYRFTMPDGDVYITAEFERTTMPFTDVRTTDWYYDEVLYVYNNGLMEGVSSYSFNPSGTMTREMFWAVLGRIDGQSITGTNWASQARSWAMNEGVSDGTNPTSLITREEMVTMLWRYAGSRAASGGLSRFNDASTISSWASTAMSWAVNNGIIDGVTSNTIQPRGTADRAQCAAIFMRYDQM